MGGKSSAPAPDPRLAEAQIRSINRQDDMMSRMLANSEELMPLQRQQMQFGLDSARTAYDQSQADREWMLSRRGALSSVQDRLIKDADEFDLEGRTSKMLGVADADVNEAFAASRGQMNRDLARSGVAPGSGRALAFANAGAIAQAGARASAANKVREAARAEGYALTDRAQNALAGYPAMGMSATGAGAGYGSMGLGLANQGLSGMNSGFGAVGGMAGQMGQNATSMYSAQANYKLGADQNAAKAGSSLMSGLGGLAGMGLKIYTSSMSGATGGNGIFGLFSSGKAKGG